MTDSTPQPMTDEESAAWVRKQWQHANMFLAEKGVIPSTLNHKESRYLIPVLALWKITGEDNKTYWVINGELPTDFMLVENAPDARDAMRHFALKWQVKAANTRAVHNSAVRLISYKTALNLCTVFTKMNRSGQVK